MKRIIESLATLSAITCLAFAGCAAAPSQAISRIAFGSCIKQDQPQPIWNSIVAQEPDVFILLGDNIYADTIDMEKMRTEYAKLTAAPGYVALKETCKILATWDDHDFGQNDGGADYPMRAGSQREFLRAFDEPADSPRWNRPGVYDAHIFGPAGKRVQIILLDTRYFRSPLRRRDPRTPGSGAYVANHDPAATMLGDAQWKWLEDQLRQPAELRIIASGIQVVSEDHGWEKWMNLPRERERLFGLIGDTNAQDVLFISGDRHFAELSKMESEAVNYPLYDLTSSGMNCARPEWYADPNRHRVGKMIVGDNFAIITVDWNSPNPQVCLEIHTHEGGLALQQCVGLGELKRVANRG